MEIAEAIEEAKAKVQEQQSALEQAKEQQAENTSPQHPEKKRNGVFLFTTKTCPNCKIAKEFLKNETYTLVDAEENPELTDAYGIMQAPTLVLVKNGEISKFVNASNIKKYVDSRRH